MRDYLLNWTFWLGVLLGALILLLVIAWDSYIPGESIQLPPLFLPQIPA